MPSPPLTSTPGLHWLRQDSSAEGGPLAAEAFLARLRQKAVGGMAWLGALDSATSMSHRMLDELAELLQHKADIVGAATSRGASNDRRDISARPLLKLLDRHAADALKQARDSLERLSGLEGVRYRSRWYDSLPVTFSKLTDHHVSSLAYIDWAVRAGRLPWRSQTILESLLERDASLQWAWEYGAAAITAQPPPETDDYAEARVAMQQELDEHRQAAHAAEQEFRDFIANHMANDAIALLAARPFGSATTRRPMESEGLPWTCFAPWVGDGCRYDVPAWPFLRSLGKGDPSVRAAVRQGKARRLLGSLLCMPEDHSIEPLPSVGNNRGSADQARIAWQQVADAGRALSLSGVAVELLSNTLARGSRANRRCRVCWRHLRSNGRVHCTLHLPNPKIRSDANRLEAWARLRARRWEELVDDIAMRPQIEEAVESIARSWNDAGEPWAPPASRHPPAFRLRHLLHELLPFTEGLVATQLEALLVRTSIQCEPQHLQPAALHPIAFFRAYFLGSAIDHSGDAPQDARHPLNAGKERGSAGTAMDARDLIRDLLMQRTWYEIGGLDMDRQAFGRRQSGVKGAFIPSPHRERNRINLPQALELIAKGKNQAAIAAFFRVSRSAVSQFFKLHGLTRSQR